MNVLVHLQLMILGTSRSTWSSPFPFNPSRSSICRSTCITKRRRTRYASVLFVMRQYNGYLQRIRIGNRASPTFSNFIEKRSKHRGNSAADHNHLRLEEIDDVAKPIRQDIKRFCEYCLCDG